MTANERAARWRANNPEKVIEVRKRFQEKMRLAGASTYFPEKRKAYRDAALSALGGVCCECGFDDWRILHIDHVNGDGAEHRRKLSSGYAYYREIIADESGRFQLLCPNCHALKTLEEGKTIGRPRRKKYMTRNPKPVKITLPGVEEE